MTASKILAAIAIASGIATSASALTISQTNVIPTQKTDFTASFGTFNPFNTSLGTLVSVTATLTVAAQDNGTLTNTAASSQSFTFATNNSSFISGGPSPLVAAFGGSTPLKLSSATASYTNLAAGASAPFPLTGTNGFNPSTVSGQNTFTAASDLNAFESGAFSVNLATLTSQTFSGGGGNIDASLDTTEGAYLNITYTYNAPVPPSVPEPATIALLGAGLLGLACVRRTARR